MAKSGAGFAASMLTGGFGDTTAVKTKGVALGAM